MKSKLLLALLLVPFVAKGQAVQFDNYGNQIGEPVQMVVAGGGLYIGLPKNPVNDHVKSNQVMAVFGSFLLTDRSDEGSGVSVKTEMKMKDYAALEIKGDWVVKSKDAAAVGFTQGDPLFVGALVESPSSGVSSGTEAKGAVWFSPMDTAPDASVSLYRKSATSENLNYGGANIKRKQSIITVPYTDGGVKKVSAYAHFPNIVVDQQAYLSIPSQTKLYVAAQDIDGNIGTKIASGAAITLYDNVGDIIVEPGGLFSVEARYVESLVNDINLTGARSMNVPTLFFNKIVRKSSALAETDPNYARGQVLYDLSVYDDAVTEEGGYGSNIVENAANGKSKKVTLTPFGSSFKELGRDYMMFNTLALIKGSDITGGAEGPLVDPKVTIKPTEAYFMAYDVSDFDYDKIETGTIRREDRAVGGLHLNRELFLNKFTGFNKFNANATEIEAIYNNENLLSPFETTTVELKNQMNFFSVPGFKKFDFSDLLAPFGSNKTLTAWSDGTPVVVGDLAGANVRNKVWVPHSASIQYDTEYVNQSTRHLYIYRVLYRDYQYEGGTGGSIEIGESNKHLAVLQPMGVMGVQALVPSGTLKMKLPLSESVIKLEGYNNNTGWSARSSKVADERFDEFILQTNVLESTDGSVKFGIEDRVSIVMRDNAGFSLGDAIDTRKSITNTAGESSSKIGVRSFTDKDIAPFGGVLYTKSAEGLALMTNAIPATAKELALYFTPTEKETVVRLTTGRMESMRSIDGVWLIDKFDNNRVVELTPDTEYEFISKPLSEELAKENRFLIRFGAKPGDDVTEEPSVNNPIVCYYNGNTLYIKKLIDEDINSTVQIYDLQGRLIGSTKIDEAPEFKYPRQLSLGTYIVKISGSRNQAIKVVVLPK